MNRRILAILMAICMAAAMLPAGAMAEEAQSEWIEATVPEAQDPGDAPGLQMAAEPEAAEFPEAEDPQFPDDAQTVPMPEEPDAEPSAEPEPLTPPDDVRFNVGSVTLGVGEESEALKVILGTREDVTYDPAVTFTSSKPRYVTIDANGKLTGLKKGKAVVTVTTANGLQASCNIIVKKAPTKITVAPSDLEMNIGETAKLKYTLKSSSAGGSVAWSSSDPAVVAVDPASGELTAKDGGTATVTATTYNGKSASATVKVYEAPETVALDPAEVTLGVGQRVKVSAVMNEGARSELAYFTSNDHVAMFTNGFVTGVSEGAAQVGVMTANGLEAVCQVTVVAAPTSVSLPFTTLYLGVGEAFQLAPESDGGVAGFTYTSARPKYAKVSKDGVVTGVKVGATDVTVRTYNGLTCKFRAVVRKAPTKLTVSPTARDLGVGEAFALKASLTTGASGGVTFESSAPEVAAVDPEGRVTALAEGEAVITARAYNGLTAECALTVHPAPTSVEIDNNFYVLSAGQTAALNPTLSEGSWTTMTYESADPDIATVSDDGVITGIKGGETTVAVRTHVPGVETTAYVTVWDAPTEVTLEVSELTLNVGETYALKPAIPEGSRTEFSYASSNEAVATVSGEGVIAALGHGRATVTVTTHNGKKASLALTVYDPEWPETVTLLETVPMLKKGKTWQVAYEVKPEAADAELVWTSSDESVVTVDQHGLITAVGYGYATVSAVSAKNENCQMAFTVAVETEALSLVIPARTTDIDGISANLAKIEAIRKSAIQEINRLANNHTISESDATKRRAMVNGIMDCYAFPWMTPKLQKYWKAKNSENGAKDFKPDRVYYGLPYISGTGTNRNYTPALALSQNRYYDTGNGYYMLNQDNLLNGKYVGNDCSGLVSVVIWGLNSTHTKDRTDDIGYSTDYRTINDYTAMRPGDLLCKPDAHVVMFLYYANSAKTKIMMIENGGAEAGTNTVHCDVHELSYYIERGYKVRRLAKLDK